MLFSTSKPKLHSYNLSQTQPSYISIANSIKHHNDPQITHTRKKAISSCKTRLSHSRQPHKAIFASQKANAHTHTHTPLTFRSDILDFAIIISPWNSFIHTCKRDDWRDLLRRIKGNEHTPTPDYCRDDNVEYL